MPDIISQLREDFSDFTSAVRQESNGSCIVMNSNWKGKTPGVRKIEVRLTGINPLTGKSVDSAGVCGVFSADNTNYKSDALTYHGEYQLKFTAFLTNGEIAENFREPKTVEFFNPTKKPVISCEIKKLSGFTLLTVDCNCWIIAENNIWLKFGNHYQPVPKPAVGAKRTSWIVPTEENLTVEFSPELRKYLK